MIKATRHPIVFRVGSMLLAGVLGSALTGLACGASAPPPTASAGHGTIRSAMKHVSVRDAAVKVAETAGLVLDNPEALSTRAVSFRFKDMDAMKALKLLARVDGKRAVFSGKHVRIETH